MIHHINDSEYPLRDLREAYKGEKENDKNMERRLTKSLEDKIASLDINQTVRLAAEIVRNRFQRNWKSVCGLFRLLTAFPL